MPSRPAYTVTLKVWYCKLSTSVLLPELQFSEGNWKYWNRLTLKLDVIGCNGRGENKLG